MKKIILALLLVGMGVGLYGQALAEPISTSNSTETVFIKGSMGTFLSQWFFDTYRSELSSMPGQVNETIPPISGATGSAALGIDLADEFSFFISSEWLPSNWAVLANAQYTFSNLGPVKPYVYIGLGLAFANDESIGECAQLGIGSEFPLTQNFNAFVETKFYVANTDWSSPNGVGPSASVVQWDLYFPVLAGLKLSL
jgi:hypothetical protein